MGVSSIFDSIYRLINFQFGISLLATLLFSQAHGLDRKEIESLKQQADIEGWTFSVGENSATPYSLEELCGLQVPENWQEDARFIDIEPTKILPDAFDWRDQNGCTPIRNQAGCGSCWAFATIGALECSIKIRDGVSVDLSEQWLVSCNQNGWGCGGGWYAFDYFLSETDPCGDVGAVMESDFPYTATDQFCSCPYVHYYTIDNWGYIGKPYGWAEVDAVKQAILDYGPVAVGVSATSAMQTYNGGIFNSCVAGEINHSVVLVGWDDNQGDGGIWIMRNSWGTGWGEQGYMRIPYYCTDIGYAPTFVDYSAPRLLNFEYPEDRPLFASPSEATTFEVTIVPANGGIIVSGSENIFYSIDGAPYSIEPLSLVSGNQYTATLPAVSCGSEVEYYLSVDEELGATFTDPSPATPYSAKSVTDQIIIFEDNFESDQSWTVSGNAQDGHWMRGIPIGGGDRGDPAEDYDGSGACYLTDNVDGDSDVENGTVYLESPLLDLSDGDALIKYARWYSNSTGSAPYLDTMRIFISSNAGTSWILVEEVGPVEQSDGGWYENTIWTNDFVIPSSQTKLLFEVSDLGANSVIEAAVDAIEIISYTCGTTEPLSIITSQIPDWTEDYPLSIPLQATGGIPPYNWLDKYNDLLNTGLQLNSNGLLSGTPSMEGPVTLTAEVTDAEDNIIEKEFGFVINDAISITTSSLPDWTAGIPYEVQLDVTGGTGDLVWNDLYASLEGSGLTLSSSGIIAGTCADSDIFELTARVTDVVGATAQSAYTFVINPAVSISTGIIPLCSLDIPYSFQIEASGGTGNLIFNEIFEGDEGVLETLGLALSSEGLLTGTAAHLGNYEIAIQAEDGPGSQDSKTYQLEIIRPYICGDANNDKSINIADAVYLNNLVFNEGPAPVFIEAGDANCDSSLNIGDAVYISNHVFKNGDPPCCP